MLIPMLTTDRPTDPQADRPSRRPRRQHSRRCGARHRLLQALIVLVVALPAAAAAANPARVRALNLARNWAVNANGGLSVYRPAACMFMTASGGGPCLLRANGAGFLFRFRGGPPGWQQQGDPATLQTEIQISPDGRRVVGVPYNGRPR
jgi:hypothetical protein